MGKPGKLMSETRKNAIVGNKEERWK